MMINIEAYVGKRVSIVDTNNTKWTGKVKYYNAEDYFDDYEGESIDVEVENSPFKESSSICFAKCDIKSIAVI